MFLGGSAFMRRMRVHWRIFHALLYATPPYGGVPVFIFIQRGVSPLTRLHPTLRYAAHVRGLRVRLAFARMAKWNVIRPCQDG